MRLALLALLPLALSGCFGSGASHDVAVYVLDETHQGAGVDVVFHAAGAEDQSIHIDAPNGSSPPPNVGGPKHVTWKTSDVTVGAYDAATKQRTTRAIDPGQTPFLVIFVRTSGLEIRALPTPPTFV